MTFFRPARRDERQAGGALLVRILVDPVAFILRLAFGAVVVLVVVAGLFYLRLSQGPIHLPFATGIAERLFNENADRIGVELGDVVLTLGESGNLPGVQFLDVVVTGADGERLFAVPRLAANFDSIDLVTGYVRPTRITLFGPVARVLRTRDGRFRFGLGASPEQETGPGALVEETPQLAAIQRFLDGLAGDAALAPELSRLTIVRILDADLTFENQASGRRWRSRQADFSIERLADGLRAKLTLGLADGRESGARIDLTAQRRRGSGATWVSVRFDRLRPEHLSEQLEQMEWLRQFDAPLNGNVEMTLRADGQVERLAGKIAAGPGRILALDEHGQPFDSIELAFAYQPGLERMQIGELRLVSQALDTRLSGFVDLERSADGEITGLAGQFEIAGMRISLPQAFAGPLQFDGGRIVAGLEFEPMRIEVAEAHLRRGELIFDVTGRARAGADGWQTDLRAGGRNMTVAQLLEHWPLAAATNARAWVEENISDGMVDELVATMRFGRGEARFNLDFTYSGLHSTYLGELSPIHAASGRGSVTLDEFHLTMASGQVEPIQGSPVSLDGSFMRMLNLQGRSSQADISIIATGATNSILTLIEQRPLRLMGKLGLDPASIGGQARVTTRLGFPLLARLKLEEIEVDARARLSALRLPIRLPGGYLADVAGDSVTLRASTREMSISGRISVAGVPLAIDWNEYYGRGANHRTIALNGAVTPKLLERFGLDNEIFADGRAPMTLRLTQKGRPDFAFSLDANLAPAGLRVPEIGWVKPVGADGRLRAEGTFGSNIRLSKFDLDTGDLRASGAIDLGAGGELTSARIDRLQFRGLADIAVVVVPDRARGGLAVTVTGNRLDLALLDDLPAGDGPGGPKQATPLTVDFNLDELILNPKMIVRPAAGTYRRAADRRVTAELGGRMAGRAPFVATYQKARGEAAEVEISSRDAGGLLAAAKLFSGAQGGRLRLKARLAPDGGADAGAVTGLARIEDVSIRGTGTFTSILDQGDLTNAASAAHGGGLFFDNVTVPFEYRDGTLTLGTTIAKGTLLAVKVEGTLDTVSQRIDLVGVISPAYALTGIFDSIPIIGNILSGGKGEGIFAMVFSVSGPLEKPNFTVNPLSLLAPGILRSIFSGRGQVPNRRFLEELTRDED